MTARGFLCILHRRKKNKTKLKSNKKRAMPGLNLSQVSEQKTVIEKHPIFGKGLIAIVVVLLLSLAAWRGLVFWEERVTGEITAIEKETARIRADFEGEQADRVADFQFRLDIIGKSFQDRVRPADMLRSLEALVLPGVDLSEYSFDSKDRTIAIAGEADSFLTAAQQMAILKRTPGFASLSVESLEREENGKVGFNFSINLSGTL